MCTTSQSTPAFISCNTPNHGFKFVYLTSILRGWYTNIINEDRKLF